MVNKQESRELMKSLGIDGRLSHQPLDLIRMCELIAELRAQVAALEKKKR